MNKHYGAPAAAPVDPIQAAIGQFPNGVPMPALTASAPDAVLIVHLHRGDPIGSIVLEIEQIYLPARLRLAAPVAILDAEQKAFRDRNRALMQTVPPKGYQSDGRNVAEWHRDIAVLRSCLDHREWLMGFLARWENLDGTTRAAELDQFERRARVQAFQGSAGTVAIQAPVDWLAVLSELAREGTVVTAAGGGNLSVTNANRLSPDVRGRLSANKAAILAALGTAETI